MKKFLFALMAAATVIVGCAKVSDLNELKGRVDTLEGKVASLENTPEMEPTRVLYLPRLVRYS